LRIIRRQAFAQWISGLQAGCAVVNLPHFVKTYAGRVVEGMAAGRPVISWEIPDRPRNTALFEANREILLFSRDVPTQLAEHIRHIRREPGFAQQLVERARRKLRRFHTLEKRVQHILRWLEAGDEPDYDDGSVP
jgi:glycosyltransferase involved in cell wall biosynthesis